MAGSNGGHNRHHPALTNADVGNAIYEYRKGRPVADIAAGLGVTEGAIYYHLHKRHVTEAKPRTANPRRLSAARIAARTRGLVDLPEALTAALAGEPGNDWTEQALCAQVDGELWFPEKGGSTREAKAVCARCPVAAECLNYALAHTEAFGVWGGKSERERRQLLRDNTNHEAKEAS